MNKWEIWTHPFPSERDPHPVVIISPQALCANQKVIGVNALACRSLRGDMAAKSHEVILNGADGLDGKTIVDCSLIHVIHKERVIGARRGIVTPARRAQILRTVYARLEQLSH